MSSLAIINRSSPYKGQAGQESVDLALAAATFGQVVSVFFVDDGVFQLLKEQTPQTIESKHFAKSFGAFEFYDIENIYVCQKSLAARNISREQLLIEATPIDSEQFNALISQHSGVLILK
ncbi:sulfurtransferase complex subunit TusC [Aliiglaciecola sp. LCG003]|uniref:sulfurtransferase complex subunit TusC n=1 Tax=Aliiglaciecola sp. LCG003 TaxID=3053655 RepID=UPI0025747D87|nr:sulfurtransferase complex subunit TusC [Aliiglaciecola sp. LCG003]WJG11176.1 sulfurtransferase complex subunit TusC [Aliiglaciecola sp. LCG003]